MEIETLRKQIDSLDDQLVELFDKRMDLCREIGILKAAQNNVVNVPERERSILNRLAQKVSDEKKVFLKQIYNTIFHASKAYQSRFVQSSSNILQKITDALALKQEFPVSTTVACQGVDGAYSSIAAEKMVPLPNITFFKTFEGVFEAIENGLCKFGVLPIENSNTGSILPVYDLMQKHKFFIVRSVRVPVKHALVAKRGADLSRIKKVVSHEQGLLQCSKFLKKMNVQSDSVANTAVAARMVAESGDQTLAAICSPESAEIWGLQVLQTNIQNVANNYTRFICISKDLQIFSGASKISVVVNTAHTPGSLNNLLSRFSALSLNVTKLESRPISNSEFEFLFYFDFEADITSKSVQNLVADLENSTQSFAFLGSYAETV